MSLIKAGDNHGGSDQDGWLFSRGWVIRSTSWFSGQLLDQKGTAAWAHGDPLTILTSDPEDRPVRAFVVGADHRAPYKVRPAAPALVPSVLQTNSHR